MNYVDFWPRRDPEPSFEKFSKTRDFGDDGGRVGGIHLVNPPLITFKDCIYGRKKFERRTVYAVQVYPFMLPFPLLREKWVWNIGALWVK